MDGKIFINYRRGDDPQAVGRLFDWLQDVFKPEQLFLDVDDIGPGEDFLHVLSKRVMECDIFLAVIGKGWIDARDVVGARRLDDPNDFVRREIAAAFDQNKRVIPVLVGGASLPRAEQLPEALRALVSRNAVRLTYERFRADIEDLIRALQRALTEIENDNRRKAQEAEAKAWQDAHERAESLGRGRTEKDSRDKKTVADQRELSAEPLVAAALLGGLALLSSLMAASSPWIFARIRIFPTSILPSAYPGVYTEEVPLLPAIWFAIVLCTGFFLWESKKLSRLPLIFGAVLLGWVIAWEGACAILYAHGLGILSGIVGGVAGGFAVSGFIALALCVCSRDFRSATPVAAVILTGTILGSAYSLTTTPYTGSGLIWVYLIWEPPVAALIAYFVVEPKSRRARPNQFQVVSRKGVFGVIIGCAICLAGFAFLKSMEMPISLREMAQYSETADSVDRLKAYANDCRLCVFKSDALNKISELEAAAPLTNQNEQSLVQGETFRECSRCPQMTVVPKGSFLMGSPPTEIGSYSEGPQHVVTIAERFAVDPYALTFDEWDACVADGGCRRYSPSDHGWGRANRPVINISWQDALAYVNWVSKKTGRQYRMLSEAEWEYAARAGTHTAYWFGNSVTATDANYKATSQKQTVTVDSYAPNLWGLFQVNGNVYEWVADCWHETYTGAPADGSAWITGDCRSRVVRGGSWSSGAGDLRSASRGAGDVNARSDNTGFRIGRSLLPGIWN
jgi:formylglycine-generating enzyme required for sulfatase activity